jgi:hypothetical protein
VRAAQHFRQILLHAAACFLLLAYSCQLPAVAAAACFLLLASRCLLSPESELTRSPGTRIGCRARVAQPQPLYLAIVDGGFNQLGSDEPLTKHERPPDGIRGSSTSRRPASSSQTVTMRSSVRRPLAYCCFLLSRVPVCAALRECHPSRPGVQPREKTQQDGHERHSISYTCKAWQSSDVQCSRTARTASHCIPDPWLLGLKEPSGELS